MSTISKLLEVIDTATGDASSTFTRICEASWNGVKSYGDVDVTAPFSGFCLQVDVCFFMMLLLQGNIFTCHFTVESQPHQPSLLYHTTRYRKEFPYYANIPDTHSNAIGAIHSVDGYTVKILCRSQGKYSSFLCRVSRISRTSL